MNKQRADLLNAHLTAAFISKVCGCVSDEVSEQSMASIDLQIAIAKKDWATVSSLLGGMFGADNLARISMRCIDLAGGIDKGKDLSAPPKSPLSEKIGLAGEPRRSFFVSATVRCMDAIQKMSKPSSWTLQRIRAYCECSSTYVADRVSEASLVRSIEGSNGDMPSEVERLDATAQEMCIARLFD